MSLSSKHYNATTIVVQLLNFTRFTIEKLKQKKKKSNTFTTEVLMDRSIRSSLTVSNNFNMPSIFVYIFRLHGVYSITNNTMVSKKILGKKKLKIGNIAMKKTHFVI